MRTNKILFQEQHNYTRSLKGNIRHTTGNITNKYSWIIIKPAVKVTEGEQQIYVKETYWSKSSNK